MKVFYVTNTTTVQEFQEIAQAVRTVPEARRTFTYNAQKAIIVRGTADQVAMAEKLIHDLDKPKSEVVVDVVVMEANSSHTRDLAASILAAGKAGLSIPIAFTPRNPILTGSTTGTGTTTTTTTSSAISLARIGHISTNDFSTTLPGALLNALMTDSNARVRQTPQIRASDGQKATLNIGDRIPYATGSFQPGVGTVGVSPLVQTQFNFVDTGVNVEITPYVHSGEEVTLHVDVNVSTIRDRIDLGGISQPIIGQRKSVADIRLRDGEVTILGGLTQMQDSSSSNGIPGLVNIPILGKFFFGSQSTNKERGTVVDRIDSAHCAHAELHTRESARDRGGERFDCEVVARTACEPTACDATGRTAVSNSTGWESSHRACGCTRRFRRSAIQRAESRRESVDPAARRTGSSYGGAACSVDNACRHAAAKYAASVGRSPRHLFAGGAASATVRSCRGQRASRECKRPVRDHVAETQVRSSDAEIERCDARRDDPARRRPGDVG
jgi:general secretion pathway protein D